MTATDALRRACDQALSSLQALAGDPAATARLDTAFTAADGAAVTDVMTAAGFDAALLPSTSFHAINTKGTGSQGRAASSAPAGAGLDGGFGMRITIRSRPRDREFVGHVTLLK